MKVKEEKNGPHSKFQKEIHTVGKNCVGKEHQNVTKSLQNHRVRLQISELSLRVGFHLLRNGGNHEY